jgi:hypothetical protein
MKKRKGTIHSVDPVLFQRYLNSQPDHVLATLISEFGFKPSMMFKSSALWKHFIKWQKTPDESASLEEQRKVLERMRNNANAIHSAPVINGPSFEDGV